MESHFSNGDLILDVLQEQLQVLDSDNEEKIGDNAGKNLNSLFNEMKNQSINEIDYVRKALEVAEDICSVSHLYHQRLLRMQYEDRPNGLQKCIGVLLVVRESLSSHFNFTTV